MLSSKDAHPAKALERKHKAVQWVWSEVNEAQQMPISCSSCPLCLLSCNSQDKRWDKRMEHLSQHLSRQQKYKNIRGCRMSKQPVMWGKPIEVRTWGVFLFSCCVSIHPLQCSWLKTTQHADTHIWERLTSLSPVLLVISPAHRAEKDPGSNDNAWHWHCCTATLKYANCGMCAVIVSP